MTAQTAMERDRHLIVATIVALLGAAASIWVSPGMHGVLGATLAVLAVSIAAVDMRQFIIPNGLVAAGLVLAFVHAAVGQPGAVAGALLGAGIRAAVTGLIFLGVRAAYLHLRGREGLGLGDVKLAAMAGAWLDMTTIPIAVTLAALAALASHGLRQVLTGRPLRATNRVPFGLFFAPAIWWAWLFEATLRAPP